MTDLANYLGKFTGSWKLESSEKFDEYMKAVNVGFMMRKLGSVAKPTITLGVDGEEVVIKTETTFSNSELRFKPDQEFDETTSDGRKAKSIFKLVDNKLVQDQKGEGIVPSIITRELQDDDTLLCTCEAKDVKSTRIYKRVPVEQQ